MENKIDEIREHIYEIKLDLREHMRRTSQNEEMIRILKADLETERENLEPMKKAFIGAKWSISAVITICTILAVVLKFK